MAKREISIDITPDGEVTFRIKGAKGKKCLELTKAIEEELGHVKERTFTSEYYEAEVVQDETVKVEK